jgi:hypothetical protein
LRSAQVGMECEGGATEIEHRMQWRSTQSEPSARRQAPLGAKKA